MSDNTQKANEIRQNVVDLVRRQNPKYIPTMSQMRAWPIFDSGYVLSEALKSEEKMLSVACNMCEKYDYDFHWDPGIRFPYKVYDVLGSSPYIFDDANQRIEYIDTPYMYEDEYDELIEKKILKFCFEKVFPRRFHLQNVPEEDRIQLLADAMKAHVETNKFQASVLAHLKKTYGAPITKGSVAMNIPTEFLFGSLRGIKGMSIDIRRKKEVVHQALDAIDDGKIAIACKQVENYKDPENVVFPVITTMLAHVILNSKQFGEFYWPYMKPYIDAMGKSGVIGGVYVEGHVSHLVDYFKDIPTDTCGLLVEQDDLIETANKLPNMTIIGGIPSAVLGTGTKDEVERETKKLIDALGKDGKLIFSTQKMLAFPCDATAENLRISNQYVHEYGVLR